jgi:hypothetical protein
LLLAVVVFTLAARVAIPVFAQTPTGSIRGTVTDEQGAVIQQAQVTVTNKATGDVRKVSTGGDGIYQASSLLPGEYEVRIEAQGFSTQIIALVVQVGNTTTGDASLRVGAASEIVDVTAEAPQIDKQNYKIDGVITRQKIDALPLNGRNFLQLALLEPGVGVSASNPGAQNNLFNVSIGGAPASLTRLTVDGGSILDPVCGGAAQNFSTESIQEFQISTFNFDLSTGVTSVGAVNIVSRTGTNEFHGSAFLFWRDSDFAAVPTLAQPGSGRSLDFSRYQYGGALGGPIKKDRAHFFANLEWLNQEALFSTIHTGFPGVSQFDTITASPYDGLVANARVDFKINDKHSLFGRFSHDDNEAFAPIRVNSLPSYWRVNTNDDQNVLTGLTTIVNQNVVNDFRFNYHRIVNDSLLPTEEDCPASNPGCIGRGGVQVNVVGSNLTFGNQESAPQNRVLDRYQFTDNLNWQKGAHRLRFGGEWEHDYGKGGWAFADPAIIFLHDPQVVQFVNAQIAGAPIPAQLKAALTIPLPAAFMTPGATITVNDILQLPIAAAAVGIGDPAQPPPFNQETARQSDRYRFYAQDSWLVRPGFTFSFGASYLYETNLFNHDLAKPALLRPLVGSLEPSDKDKNNIAPSVGFAWDVRNDGKTVVRGGAGIYYDTSLFVTRLRERANIGPLGNGRVLVPGDFFQNTLQFPQVPTLPGPLAPFNLINPRPGTPINFQVIPTKFTGQNFLDLLAAQSPIIQQQLQALGSAGVTGLDFFKTGTDFLDPNNVTPYSEQFTVGVQRQLRGNMAVSADFVMRKRLHTLFQTDYNLNDRAIALGGPVIPRCVGAQAVDPTAKCSNGPISVIQSSGREEYRALLVKLDKRFSDRYQFTASYALSRLRGFATGEDLTNWFGHFGDLGADARHRFTFSGVVDLPWGFQASVISVLSTRPPFTARVPSNIDLNGDGTGGDLLPGLEIDSLNRGVSKDELRRLVNEFNVRFAGTQDARGATIPPLILPADFDFGDSFQSHDVRLSKSFTFAERYSIQGLFEVFNLFNNANLTGYSTRLDQGALVNGVIVPRTANFGQATGRVGQNFGTGGPRAFQFGARFSF